MWFQVNSFQHATKTNSQSCVRLRIQRFDPIAADALPGGIGGIDSLVDQQLSFANDELMAVWKQIAFGICRQNLARLGMSAIPEIQIGRGPLEQTGCIEYHTGVRGHRGFKRGPVLETGLERDNGQRELALHLIAAVVNIAGCFARKSKQDAKTVLRS